MGIRNSIYSYIGNGINGLFSNRVKLDTVNKTIEESGNTSSLNAQKHYNLLQPVSLAVNKISQDASRILIELQDNDGVTIDDKDILNKYYYFLENKYGQNGISFSYQDLIVQIVSNLKLNNEYFLRIFYHNIKIISNFFSLKHPRQPMSVHKNVQPIRSSRLAGYRQHVYINVLFY